jgi:flagellar FliJ protein
VKRFRFSLDTLLRVKKQREQLAEARVAQARLEVEACQGRLARLQDALQEVARRLESALGSALPAESWAGTFEQSARLERAIRAAEYRLAQAEVALRDAIQARTRLTTEVEALDTLKQQHWDLYRQDMQRAEQERLDEVGLRLWLRAQRNGRPGT